MPKGGKIKNKDSKKVSLSVHVKKDKVKRKARTVKKKAVKTDKKIIDPNTKAIKKEPNLEEARIVSMKIEREKRLIMWSGVIFFMILISFFWIYNTRKVFMNSRLESKSTITEDKTWQELSQEISGKIEDLKEGLKEVEEFTQEPSSTAIVNTEKQERSLFELPVAGTSTIKSDASSTSGSVDKLKEKLEELNNN
jgi:hypothetical protein